MSSFWGFSIYYPLRHTWKAYFQEISHLRSFKFFGSRAKWKFGWVLTNLKVGYLKIGLFQLRRDAKFKLWHIFVVFVTYNLNLETISKSVCKSVLELLNPNSPPLYGSGLTVDNGQSDIFTENIFLATFILHYQKKRLLTWFGQKF